MTSKVKVFLPFLIFAVILCVAVGRIYSGTTYDLSATIKEVTKLENGDIKLRIGDIHYSYEGTESELTLVVPEELTRRRQNLLVTGLGIRCDYKDQNGVNTVTKIY